MLQFFNLYCWDISGRITRKQYLMLFIIMSIYSIFIITTIIIANYFNDNSDILTAILTIPLIWSGTISTIKRIRDTGLSPWWYILQLLPYMGVTVGLSSWWNLLQILPYIGIIIGLTFVLVPTNYLDRKTQEVIVQILTPDHKNNT